MRVRGARGLGGNTCVGASGRGGGTGRGGERRRGSEVRAERGGSGREGAAGGSVGGAGGGEKRVGSSGPACVSGFGGMRCVGVRVCRLSHEMEGVSGCHPECPSRCVGRAAVRLAWGRERARGGVLGKEGCAVRRFVRQWMSQSPCLRIWISLFCVSVTPSYTSTTVWNGGRKHAVCCIGEVVFCLRE